jgi:hypothetical protein
MFGPRDYWDLQNGFVAMVTDDDSIVSISINKDRSSFTEQAIVQLQSDKDYPYITKGYGIDAVFIECPSDKLNDVLIKIEEICKTL